MLRREDLETLRGLRGWEWAIEDVAGRAVVDFDAPVEEGLAALSAAGVEVEP
jgi:hypothetical protein